jgi:hypothetical protein
MDKGSFTVSIIGPNPDDLDDLAERASSLRSDLAEVKGITVSEVPSGEPAEGTRSAIIPDAVGSLAVLYYGGKLAKWALEDLSRIFRSWLERNKGKRVIVKHNGKEIDLSNLSENEILSVLSAIEKDDDASEHQEVG